MTKRKAPTKASSTKKKTSKTTKTATPQPIRAPPQRIRASSTPPPILDLTGDAPIQINEDDVAVNKDSSPSPQYTVSHTVYLNEKVVDEDLKVYQLNDG